MPAARDVGRKLILYLCIQKSPGTIVLESILQYITGKHIPQKNVLSMIHPEDVFGLRLFLACMQTHSDWVSVSTAGHVPLVGIGNSLLACLGRGGQGSNLLGLEVPPAQP